MVYLKGFLGGILGLATLAVAYIVIGALRYKGKPVAWDPISLFHSPVFWILVVLFFGMGSYLSVRRFSHW